MGQLANQDPAKSEQVSLFKFTTRTTVVDLLIMLMQIHERAPCRTLTAVTVRRHRQHATSRPQRTGHTRARSAGALARKGRRAAAAGMSWYSGSGAWGAGESTGAAAAASSWEDPVAKYKAAKAKAKAMGGGGGGKGKGKAGGQKGEGNGNKGKGKQKTGDGAARRKNKLCNYFSTTGQCTQADRCTFAHGEHEIGMPLDESQIEVVRARNELVAARNEPTADGGNLEPVPKTRLCTFHAAGNMCPHGDECTFAHGDHELEASPPLPLAAGRKGGRGRRAKDRARTGGTRWGRRQGRRRPSGSSSSSNSSSRRRRRSSSSSRRPRHCSSRPWRS
eukprot:SAG22_NODE_571_length_9011_cov_292.011670_11_plen_334_part_00